MKYFLEIHEEGERILAGNKAGYDNFAKAAAAAEKLVDDALPRNTVHITLDVAYAAMAGDGSEYVTEFDIKQPWPKPFAGSRWVIGVVANDADGGDVLLVSDIVSSPAPLFEQNGGLGAKIFRLLPNGSLLTKWFWDAERENWVKRPQDPQEK